MKTTRICSENILYKLVYFCGFHIECLVILLDYNNYFNSAEVIQTEMINFSLLSLFLLPNAGTKDLKTGERIFMDI